MNKGTRRNRRDNSIRLLEREMTKETNKAFLEWKGYNEEKIREINEKVDKQVKRNLMIALPTTLCVLSAVMGIKIANAKIDYQEEIYKTLEQKKYISRKLEDENLSLKIDETNEQYSSLEKN